MSKQSEAKEKQGYNPKPIPFICSNCAYYRSDFVEQKSYGAVWSEEKNIHCGIGKFAIKKTATCNLFELTN